MEFSINYPVGKLKSNKLNSIGPLIVYKIIAIPNPVNKLNNCPKRDNLISFFNFTCETT